MIYAYKTFIQHMVRASFRDNPLLAALLGTVITGLGHLYLRRWLRTLGWLGITVVASVHFIPESTMSAISSGMLTDPFSVFPLVLISIASILDAYLIARRKRIEMNEREDTQALGTEGANSTVSCPACGKDTDLDLGFCHWCTTEFDDLDITELNRLDEHNSN